MELTRHELIPELVPFLSRLFIFGGESESYFFSRYYNRNMSLVFLPYIQELDLLVGMNACGESRFPLVILLGRVCDAVVTDPLDPVFPTANPRANETAMRIVVTAIFCNGNRAF